MNQANDSDPGKERRISESRIMKVRQDIESSSKQLANWVSKVEKVENEINALEPSSSNKPTIIVLEARKTHYQSKVDKILKRVASSEKTLSEYIDKNNRLDDQEYGID